VTFLTPIPAIVAAAITVPLLLLYYFLKLRRMAVRVSSTLLWERAIKDLQVNTPFRWLRFSVLLLLQLAALAAFLLALARPAMDDPLGAASRVVILIDHSASMGARDGRLPASPPSTAPGAQARVTRLDQAKAEALNLVAELTHSRGWLGILGTRQDAAQICIADFSARAQVRTAFTSDPASLRDAIEGIRQTDQPGNLSAAMQLVQGVAAAQFGEEEEAVSLTLFVISDGAFEPDPQRPAPGVPDVRFIQVGPKPDRSPGASGKDDSEPSPLGSPDSAAGAFRPRVARARHDQPPLQPRDNLGITAISARRDSDTPSLVRVFVRVQNAARDAADSTLRFTLNGQPISTRRITVPGIGTPKAPPPAAPGTGAIAAPSAPSNESAPPEASFTFEIDSPDGGLAVVSLGGADLLASDDAAAIMLRPASKAKVLVVAPDAKPDGFLLNVLEVMDLPVLVTADPVYYEQLAASTSPKTSNTSRAADAASPSLDDWDLVIFDRYRPERLPPVSSLSIGVGLPIPGLSVSPIALNPSSPVPHPPVSRFVTWRRTHALMQSVNLDGVVIAPPMTLTLPESASINSTVLAWGRDENESGEPASGGPLIALLENVGNASGPSTSAKRLIVAFELVQSNWPVEDSFPPFIMNAVEYLSAKGTGLVGRAFSTTDPISVRAGPGERQIQLDGPMNFSVSVPSTGPSPRVASGDPGTPPPPPNSVETPIGILPLAGIYAVKGVARDSVDSLLAVNLCDGWESRLATSETIDIPGTRARSNADASDSRRELWQWFIVAALALLTIEWFVFARQMRV